MLPKSRTTRSGWCVFAGVCPPTPPCPLILCCCRVQVYPEEMERFKLSLPGRTLIKEVSLLQPAHFPLSPRDAVSGGLCLPPQHD